MSPRLTCSCSLGLAGREIEVLSKNIGSLVVLQPKIVCFRYLQKIDFGYNSNNFADRKLKIGTYNDAIGNVNVMPS